MDFELGNAEVCQMRHPGLPVSKDAGFVSGKLFDEHFWQTVIAHVIERRVIDLVALVAGAQKLQKVQPALGGGRRKPCETVIADVGAIAIARLMPGAGVVHRDPLGGLEPRAQNT